jgi:uncharacterized protein
MRSICPYPAPQLPKSEEPRKGGWIQTYSGKRFYPLDARAEEISLEDIAHSLANVCRFNGHCRRFYSVLEHSLHVAGLVPEELKAQALLHDASEAYLGDLVRPLKTMSEFQFFNEAEERLERTIELRFAISPMTHASVKLADKAMLWWEYNQLFDHRYFEWDKWKTYANYFPPVAIAPVAPHPEALIETFAQELLTALGHERFTGSHLELLPAEDAQ